MFRRMQVSGMYLLNQELLSPYPVPGGTLVVVKAVRKRGKRLVHIPSGERDDKELSQLINELI